MIDKRTKGVCKNINAKTELLGLKELLERTHEADTRKKKLYLSGQIAKAMREKGAS